MKTVMFAATMCLFSTMLNAQATIADIREQIAKGECEIAQSLYNVYKAQEKKTDYELERQINDCLAYKGTEGKSNWREEEVSSEIEIKTMSKKYYLSKQGEPSEKEWYNKIVSDVKRDYPNKMIGIKKGNGSICYVGRWAQYEDDYKEYIFDYEIKILEPNIRYYLNEAIRNAKDGSKIALNQVIAFGTSDKNLENQVMDILMDEGFRVVSSISDADYFINLKKDDNSLQIRMGNAVTGEYEGVSSVKYDGFIDEIKIGKGGERMIHKKCTVVITYSKKFINEFP